ncbi:MAG: alpha-glucosidase, partial [Anaerolineaceae bacterium]|nr:alpha-glucosidase [Anaerolineaceae bacterium]
GIDAIWLSPIYLSPDADFGYDVSDYIAIDPRYGSLADFDHLVSEAHKRKINIILDLVLNHTSDQHKWFIESRKSVDNLYHNWYLWRDPSPKGGKPNNWQAVFGGSGWEYDEHLMQYYYHMFYKEQPDLNWRNPEVRNAMLDDYRFWLDRGVDGFRMDVFNMYFKHPDLADNPSKFWGRRAFERQIHINDMSQPEMLPLLKEIRELLDSYGATYMVGETFLSTPKQAAAYIGPDRLHAAFDFELVNSQFSAKAFKNAIQNWNKALNGKWPNNFLNNHDSRRTATRYRADEEDAILKVSAAMLLTLKGTPFLYYGEEIGMRDINLKRSQILDRIGKRYWPFNKGRDGCRSPMQWDATQNAGFSAVPPWLPLHPNYQTRNVLNQSSNPASLLNFYKHLLKLRKTHSALRQGDIKHLDLQNQNVLSYTRSTPDEEILVCLNLSSKPSKVMLPNDLKNKHWRVLMTQSTDMESAHFKDAFFLAPYETLLFIDN